MKHLPKGGLIGKTVALGRSVARLHIPLHAANASYFIILALFPALVLLLSILRYTDLSVHSLIGMLEGVIPAALLPEAELLIINTYESTSGAVIGVSAITALWSASRGIYGLLTGLNAVYGVSESRGYLYTRLISLVYTFGFFVVLLLTLIFHVFGTSLLDLISHSDIPILQLLNSVIDLRFFLLLFMQTVLFTAMFMVFPNKKNSLMNSLPGALLSSIGWLVFSQLYSVYVERVPSYAAVYGSVYGIALSMLWLYFCILIVFYGGLLNRIVIDRPDDSGDDESFSQIT